MLHCRYSIATFLARPSNYYLNAFFLPLVICDRESILASHEPDLDIAVERKHHGQTDTLRALQYGALLTSCACGILIAF